MVINFMVRDAARNLAFCCRKSTLGKNPKYGNKFLLERLFDAESINGAQVHHALYKSIT